MQVVSFPSASRRILRRAVRARCQAVTIEDFRLVGDRILDMSPNGLLVACDDAVSVGDSLIVAFQAPGSDEWFDAEARIARIVEGWRRHDPGYCIGVSFTDIELRSRVRIARLLEGYPPPLPARPRRLARRRPALA